MLVVASKDKLNIEKIDDAVHRLIDVLGLVGRFKESEILLRKQIQDIEATMSHPSSSSSSSTQLHAFLNGLPSAR